MPAANWSCITKPAIRIRLDPAKLVAKGLSLEDVRTPLSVATVDAPKGTVRGASRSFTIYSNDQLIHSKDWNDVIVAYKGGAPIRVRDIGEAVEGPQPKGVNVERQAKGHAHREQAGEAHRNAQASRWRHDR